MFVPSLLLTKIFRNLSLQTYYYLVQLNAVFKQFVSSQGCRQVRKVLYLYSWSDDESKNCIGFILTSANHLQKVHTYDISDACFRIARSKINCFCGKSLSIIIPTLYNIMDFKSISGFLSNIEYFSNLLLMHRTLNRVKYYQYGLNRLSQC